ncbi:hypothetical protein [Burkholderia sp. BDU5]|uniref:hypothetical protein n=1 Tax=Burkholderia sp. BDU5 TaxID=1385590 RepID=UPI0012E38993|nr:hypothetical protein [Burkholderia sp. BDU5]
MNMSAQRARRCDRRGDAMRVDILNADVGLPASDDRHRRRAAVLAAARPADAIPADRRAVAVPISPRFLHINPASHVAMGRCA